MPRSLDGREPPTPNRCPSQISRKLCDTCPSLNQPTPNSPEILRTPRFAREGGGFGERSRAVVDEPLTKIVEHADASEAMQAHDFLGLLVATRVEFAILANPLLRIKPGTIATVHTRGVMGVTSLVLATVLAQQGQPADLRTITFKDGVFTLKGPEGAEQVSTLPAFRAMNMSTGQLWLPVADKVLTFTKDGVGIRHKGKTSTTKYNTVPTSDRLFTAEEIAATKEAVKAGTRKLEVSAISGWEKVGDTVYLILRWDGVKDNRPWLEVLMEVNLKGQPSAKALAKLPATTTAVGRVNDKLMAENGILFSPVQDAEGLKMASYSLADNKLDLAPMAPNRVTDARFIEGSLSGVAWTRTGAGTWLVSLLDRERKSAEVVSEIRGNMLGLYAPSILYYGRRDQRVLLNLTSGAELIVPSNVGMQSVTAGIFLWTPAQNPTAGVLYSHGGFRTLERWSAPARR